MCCHSIRVIIQHVLGMQKKNLLLVLDRRTSDVRACAFSPDSVRISSRSFGGNICVWCAEIGECQLIMEREQHTDFVTCCCFSHHGKYILTSNGDNSTSLEYYGWDSNKDFQA
mmetsp:Transcript_14678/g.18121  ORF Transcript_14678/g.18121 Transcript_14678/m.18121 type:complete len:113 (+) Transcript_14678:119-457(+)